MTASSRDLDTIVIRALQVSLWVIRNESDHQVAVYAFCHK
jgi:hypothetical protein